VIAATFSVAGAAEDFMTSFPISIAFRILTIHPQMVVREGGGAVIGYVRQNLWRFKEAVTVYADETQSREIYRIDADRVIDFNARYAITTPAGASLGAVRRHGMRSLWRASYDVAGPNHDDTVLHVSEKSTLVRFLDGLIGEIPVIGMLTGLFLQPIYYVTRADGTRVATMTKQRSLLEAHFQIAQDSALSEAERERLLLGLMMIILLERSRG
jgi:hypothetical protein